MMRKETCLSVSAFLSLMLSVVPTNADDSIPPEPVRLIEKPLTSEKAQSAQMAWARHIGFDVAFKNSIGMHLRVIPPGTFRMSSRRVEGSRNGPVEVTLSQAFFIGQFEVTQQQWKRVMGPIQEKLDAGAGDRFPAYRLNHAEATEFCRKLTQLEREAGKLPDGYQYRLPTAAEWVFACRAGTLTRHYCGEKMSSRLANYDGTRPHGDSEKGPFLGRTAEVGSYPANAWGLHDMLGNVTEWCLDCYHHEVQGGVDPMQLQPTDPGMPRMVIRGGSWKSPGEYCHSANRYFSKPASRTHIGLRPVLTKIWPVATGQADSTPSNTMSVANLDAAAGQADASEKPKPVLMTDHPLSAEQAQTAQKVWADHLGFETILENSIGLQLCVIPPGTFPMGSPKGEANRKRKEQLQEVTHTKPFFIGRYEVTQAEWERVMGEIRGPLEVGSGDRFPVYKVNHAEAREFCRNLTQLDRKAGKLPEATSTVCQLTRNGNTPAAPER